MNGRDIYKIWYFKSNLWSSWIRPVPFVAINDQYQNQEFLDFALSKINYIDSLQKDTALIVDLPGYTSIKEGISLAHLGYVPIPIFNGTNPQIGVTSTTNNREIESGLIWGASVLNDIEFPQNAPPVFLLDSNRTNRYQMNHSIFDNSWDIYHQDLPTKDFFLKNGINKIIIIGDTFNKDLQKILYKFQNHNIKILYTDGYDSPKEFKIKKIKEKD